MKVRCIVKFTKDEGIKFISHLDLMRTIQRAIRRAEIPISYSQGFNPHMIFSIAQPLSVGQYSCGEYLEIEFAEDIDISDIIQKLNSNMPNGIKILNVIAVDTDRKKYPNVMAAVEASEYDISIKCSHVDEKEISTIWNIEKWEILKKSKSKEKIVDIKPMIKKISFVTDDNIIKINTIISCGSRENLSPSLLAKYFSEKLSSYAKNSFIDIERKDMYISNNGKYMPLSEYYSITR